MTKAGEIRYCPELGGKATNAAFVWIPPGSFWMGDKDISSADTRFISLAKGFWLQQTPLTTRQYSNKDSSLPQVNISMKDVYDFCQGKPLRLPTESEWEYAARANTGHKYMWAGSNVADNVAWHHENSSRRVHNVGQLKANNYGLFDMAGNVSEWCIDLSSKSLGSGEQPYRGLSWDFNKEDARISAYYMEYTLAKNKDLGVRLIWEPKDA